MEASVHICRELGYSGSAYHCHAGTVFRRNELYTIEGISLFLYGNKRRGDTGGFKEKMQAAKKAGATAVVIDRPKDKGMSLEQTKEAVKEWMKDVSE